MQNKTEDTDRHCSGMCIKMPNRFVTYRTESNRSKVKGARRRRRRTKLEGGDRKGHAGL